MRELAELLPELEVVADCPFSCDPNDPCAPCRDRESSLPIERRRRRIVTLPLNATEDRVAGSVDIARALREGVRALEPGLLAEANRGILYVDEINLLDDHLTYILLDAAALGINVVEREGVSISHPARFLLVGTMNPDEGELRPQIADRIGLQVEVDAVLEPEARAHVMRRREAFTADAAAMSAGFEQAQAELEEQLGRAVALLPEVSVPDSLYAAIGKLVVKSGVTSHRADVTIVECSKALAALGGRREATVEDVLQAGDLALGHRLPYDPFAPPPKVDTHVLRRLLEEELDLELAKKARPERVG